MQLEVSAEEGVREDPKLCARPQASQGPPSACDGQRAAVLR